MKKPMDRRDFMKYSAIAGAVAVASQQMLAQAGPAGAPPAGAAAGQADTPINVTKLYDNLYLLQGSGGNMALQTGPDGSLLIDSSFAPAVPRILEAIAKLDPQARAGGLLVNTHWHPDHTGGNAGLHEAGFTILAHKNTYERLSKPQTMRMFNSITPASPAAAWPAIGMDERLTLWRNGDTLQLEHYAPAHTDSDLSICFEKAGVFHTGDTFFNGTYPVIDEGSGGSIGGIIRASEKTLAAVSASTKIIPGHGPLAGKADLEKFRDMLVAVRDKVAALKASGLSEQEVLAKKPSAEFDPVYGGGFMKADVFLGVVYRTV
jgi:cyclase